MFKLKVGDRVRQILYHEGDISEYATVTKVNGNSITHRHDGVDYDTNIHLYDEGGRLCLELVETKEKEIKQFGICNFVNTYYK